jgi:pimeloyl-ACP methyl ester carboxylesterase
MSGRAALACLILPIALLASACGHDSPAPRPQAETGVSLSADFTGTGPGTLLDARELPTIDRRLPAITSISGRIAYTSTSAVTNSETRVTGTVFAPKGQAPAEGWPIIALGHATSGIEPNCAPSLSPALLGLAPPVALMVQAGYVVTVTDYQGLGSDQTYHPYLEPTTEGYNLIDAVRAARKVVPDTSDRWVAAGFSQGGQAAWAANELAATYGKGLTLLGSVVLAGPIDLTSIAGTAASGGLSKEQKPVYQAILAALKNEHPDFNLDDYRHGIVKQRWDSLFHCDVIHANERNEVFDQITADDLRPSSPAATDALRRRLQEMSLPQQPATAPMLVVYGDSDPIIPVESTDGALAAACSMGDVIDIRKQPGKGHVDLDIGVALPWIVDRFEGLPVTNSCAPPLPAPPLPEPSAGGDVTSQPHEADATASPR